MTKLVKKLLSADIGCARNVSADEIVAMVNKLEQDANASVALAAKHIRRKKAEAARKKQKRRQERATICQPYLSATDSDSQLRKKKRVKKEISSDLFPATLPKPSDDWPVDYALQFWDAWPKHERKHSPKQVAAKLGRIRARGEATWAQVIGGLKAYLASQPEHRFIPAPFVWLNQSRWLADYSSRKTEAAQAPRGFAAVAFGRR